MKEQKEKHQCSERVYHPGGRMGGDPCKFNATIQLDTGEWVCKRHNPVSVQARRDANYEKWNNAQEAERIERANAKAIHEAGLRALKILEQWAVTGQFSTADVVDSLSMAKEAGWKP